MANKIVNAFDEDIVLGFLVVDVTDLTLHND